MSGMRLDEDRNGVLTATPLPTVDELREFYRNRYFQNQNAQYSGSYTEEEVEYFHIKDRVLDHIVSKNPDLPRKFLDIGCGEGFTTKYFHERGYECFAADFSVAGLNGQHPRLSEKIEFFQGDIVNDDYFTTEKFGVIAANNVLEHVIDMYAFLESVRGRLCDGGIFCVRVPNEFNTLQNEFMKRTGISEKEGAPWYSPPHHLRYFSPESLKKSVESSGFVLDHLMGDFPMELFLQHPETDYYTNTFGKTAHALRVRFSNSVSREIAPFINFSKGLMEVGIGRNIIAVFRRATAGARS